MFDIFSSDHSGVGIDSSVVPIEAGACQNEAGVQMEARDVVVGHMIVVAELEVGDVASRAYQNVQKLKSKCIYHHYWIVSFENVRAGAIDA